MMTYKEAHAKYGAVTAAIVRFYALDTKGSERFLTDSVKRALVAKATLDVMLEMKDANKQPSILEYLMASWDAERALGLRD